jgi:hypothetical protein
VASEARSHLDTASAQKAAPDRECERAEQLFKLGVLTQAQYDIQTTSCKPAASSTEAAETHVKALTQQIADGTIRAPFPGIIAERYVSVGEYVMPNTNVVHLVDIDPLRLDLTVSEMMRAPTSLSPTLYVDERGSIGPEAGRGDSTRVTSGFKVACVRGANDLSTRT